MRLFLPARFEEFVGLRKRRRDWLFDEHIETGVKQRRGYRVMVHCGNGNRSRIEVKIGSQQFVDRSENRDAEFLFCLGRVRGIRIDRRDQGNSLAGRFQFAIDTKVIAAEGAGSRSRQPVNCLRWLFLCPFAFHCFKASGVEFQQLGYVLLRLGSRGAAETCGARGGTAHTGGSGDKLEQIESDIFIAAGAETRGIEGFHADKSPKTDATRYAR